jgi:hypothetical protein
LLLRRPFGETIEAREEITSRRSRHVTETLLPQEMPNEFRGTVMKTKSSIAKYLLVRTAAFVGLTAASTAVMALPYLA